MTRRYIKLPNGRRCGLGVYVDSWKSVKSLAFENPRAELRGFGHFPEPAERVLESLRAGLHDRINRHLAYYGQGRKWSADWQRAAAQCARYVNTPRLVVHWIPHDLRARLSHRLHLED